MENEDITEVHVDPVGEALQGKKVSVTSFDSRKCSRRQLGLSSSRLMR